MNVVVFSLVKDRPEVTKQSFQSLYDKTKTPFRHVIIDQGSNPAFEARDECQFVVRLEENTGISAGTNKALDVIDVLYAADIIIKYDNDCVVLDDGAIDACIDIVSQHPDVVCSPYVEGLVRNKGGAPRTGNTHFCDYLFGTTNHIGGIVTVASREAWNDFGRHAVPAPLHGSQDGEFSQKLRSLGYTFGYLELFKVLHSDNEFTSEDKEYWSKRPGEKRMMK
jgi:GT2 family glycosyltransferase